MANLDAYTSLRPEFEYYYNSYRVDAQIYFVRLYNLYLLSEQAENPEKSRHYF